MNIDKLTRSLAVVISLALFGCGGTPDSPADVKKQAFDDLRAQVRVVITDEQREDQAIAMVGELQVTFEAIIKRRLRRAEQANALNANYDATRADFRELYDDIKTEAETNQQELSRIHRNLVNVTSDQEWAQLSKSHSKAMDAAINALQAI